MTTYLPSLLILSWPSCFEKNNSHNRRQLEQISPFEPASSNISCFAQYTSFLNDSKLIIKAYNNVRKLQKPVSISCHEPKSDLVWVSNQANWELSTLEVRARDLYSAYSDALAKSDLDGRRVCIWKVYPGMFKNQFV